MPYNTKEKRQKHYQSYQKEYMKEWKKNNPKWNEYQRDHKIKRKAKVVDRIKNLIREMNLAEEDSLCFKAGVIMFYVCETGIKKEWAIAYRLGYDLNEVKTIFTNWKSSEIYKNGKFYLDLDENDDAFQQMVEFSLMCTVGSGKIVRIALEEKPKKINQIKLG